MTLGLRKFMLTVHLTVSVGWIGAVVACLALVVAAGTSQDAQIVRAAWIAMELIIRFVIVPLALASLLTGLIMSLGTKWGLVPALLGPDLIHTHRLCHRGLAGARGGRKCTCARNR